MGIADLFRPRWKHSNPAVRREAVKCLTDELALADIAKSDDDPWVREIAVGRVAAQDVLAAIANSDRHSSVREIAVGRLTEQTALAEIAKNDSDSDVRRAAVARLTNQPLLADVAKNDKHPDVRKAAIAHMTDQGLLADVAKNDKATGWQRIFKGRQTAFFRSKEWTLTFTEDSLVVANSKDKEPIAIPRSQSGSALEICSRPLWGYDVKIRDSKRSIKLVLSRGVRAFLELWVNSQHLVELGAMLRSSRAQAKIGLLHWIYDGGFRAYRTWPGAKRTRTGVIILFVSLPTILARSKNSDLLPILVIAIGFSLFKIWKGYKEYCEAHDKGELDAKMGLY